MLLLVGEWSIAQGTEDHRADDLSPPQIAYRRFVDYVRNAIFVHFMHPIAAAAMSQILGDLGLHTSGGDERAQGYLAEDSDTRLLRDQLTARKERLDHGIRAVNEFSMGA